jgi:hypothetical protein
MEPWMESFATTTDAVRKYVVSGTLDRVDWNAELLGGDLEVAVRALKRQSGKGLDRRVRVRGNPGWRATDRR